jgi:hypothetical protein
MSDLDMSDFDSSDLFAPMVVGKQVHPSVVLGAAFAEARGKRLYQHVLGIDVEAVKQRFDELDPTNNNVKSMWLDNGHGLALAQRLDSDAQKILNTAVLPTNEFQFHDAILAFGKRAMALSDKVSALPRDDNKSPLWEEVRSYFIDGSNLANQVEGVADGSLKWSDVKDSVVSMAHGIEQGGARVGTAIQWSTYAIVGGAVVLGGGILYALYKAITSDTGKAVAVTATRAAMLR